MASVPIIVLSPATAVGSAQKCYNVAGEFVQEFVVCNATNMTRPCCAKDDSCFDGGMCKTPAGDRYQGGCIDKDFESAVCPKFCSDPSKIRISLCNLGLKRQDSERKYCCDGEGRGRCCENPKNLFEIEMGGASTSTTATKTPGTDVIDTHQTSPLSSNFVDPSTKTLTSFPALSRAATTSNPPSSASQSAIGPPSSALPSAIGPSSTSTSVIEGLNPNRAPSGTNKQGIIGAGTGAAIGIILLLGIVYVWCRHVYCGQRWPRRRHGKENSRPLGIIGLISSPSRFVNPSSRPASFQRKPSAKAGSVGLGIKTNGVHKHSTDFADFTQSDIRRHSRNIPTVPSFASSSTRAKTGPQYQTLPASPSTPGPMYLREDPASHFKNLSASPSPTSLMPPTAKYPLLARSRHGIRSTTRLRSPVLRSHPNPLRSNPLSPPPTDIPDLPVHNA